MLDDAPPRVAERKRGMSYEECKQRLEEIFKWSPGIFWTEDIFLTRIGCQYTKQLSRRQIGYLKKMFRERVPAPPGACMPM